LSSIVKPCVKRLFRLFGLEVKRIPQFEPYDWLKGKEIHTILDIGANVGQFASQFHRLLPDASLYSFEPLEDCYNELLKKMGHNPKFHAFNFALGDTNGVTQIYRNDYTPSSSLLDMEEIHKRAYPATGHATLQEIQIRQLDDILSDLDIADNLLIKIDVQGAEEKVIMGARKALSIATVLIVETCFEPLYKGQLLFDGIYELLHSRGFIYVGSEDQRRNPENGRILFCDSVFIKSDF